jgi:lysophospholipase L1-like esterase
VRQKSATLLKAILTLAAAFFATETTLWLAAPTSYYVWEPGRRAVYQPIPELLPGASNRIHFSINQAGLRGAEIPDDGLKILAAGASTTIQVFTDDQLTWPHLVGTKLTEELGTPVWVGSAGRPSIGLAENQLQLELLLEQNPGIDMVVMMVGGVDASRALQTDTPKTIQDASIGHSFGVQPRGVLRDAFWKKSRLRIKAAQLYERLAGDPRSFEFDDGTGFTLAHKRAQRQAASTLIDVRPDLTTQRNHFQKNLLAIKQLLDKRDIKLVLITQTYLYHPDLSDAEDALTWGGAVKNPLYKAAANSYYSNATRQYAYVQFNDELLDFCATQTVPCIDVDGKIGDKRGKFIDHIHFNDAGSRAVADIITQGMLQVAGNSDPEIFNPRN